MTDSLASGEWGSSDDPPSGGRPIDNEDFVLDALELLLTRESALKLVEPAPGRVALEGILSSAVRAPDHGRLRPWEFLVIEGEGREEFGRILGESLLRRRPDTSEELLDVERKKALRAPMIIVVVATIKEDTKIPQVEQLLSAGAAAQNIMLAVQAFGFAAMWKTGDAAYDPQVKQELGLQATDEIVGFLYVGTRTGRSSPLPRPKAEAHARRWPPQPA